MKKFLLVAAVILGTASVSGANAASNLVVNGDFEAGNTGFNSGYTYSPGNGIPPTVYDVTTNPHNDHPSWASFGDHTTGAGNMLVVNGTDGTTGTPLFWGENGLSVTTNTLYDFTAYVASSYPVSPATLILDINGSQVGGVFTAVSTPGDWEAFNVTWNSNGATLADLALIDTNTQFTGNDFVVDDINFSSAVPETATWVMLLLGFLGVGAMMRRRQPLQVPAAV